MVQSNILEQKRRTERAIRRFESNNGDVNEEGSRRIGLAEECRKNEGNPQKEEGSRMF